MIKDLEIAKIQRDVDEAKSNRDLASALERLEHNQDFKLLIGRAYFHDEAVRLVHLRDDPDANIEVVNKQMDAIAGLSSFFRLVRKNGEMADKSIRDGESMIEQMHSED